MASSMTGFGRSEIIDENAKITVEIKSVNHRYLDVNLKLPHRLLAFDNKIRQILREQITRGKIDVSIMYFPLSDEGSELLYNKALASMYFDRITKIQKDFNLVNDLTATRLANMRDVLIFSESEIPDDVLSGPLFECLNSALTSFLKQREDEGERLKSDMILKLEQLSKYTKEIESKSSQIIDEYKARLTEKITDLMNDTSIEQSRIATEVVIYADKVCVDEELVRLNSHIKSFKDTLELNHSIGKKLDFITQEMNREANTVLSKTQDAKISDIGIEIKTLIEKIREQVQNIE